MGLGEAACFQQQPWGAGGALQVFVGPMGLIIDFQRQVAALVSVSTVVRYCIIKRKGEQPWWEQAKGRPDANSSSTSVLNTGHKGLRSDIQLSDPKREGGFKGLLPHVP